MGTPDQLIGTVDSISACPTIQGGTGRVVLATVNHLSNVVLHLTLNAADGQSETLGVTAYHPFYTEDRGWVQAGELRSGEIVRGADGNLTVANLVADTGVYRVYNMTVETDHVFYVGDLRALVLNVGEEACF